MKRLSFSYFFYFPSLPSNSCRWQHFLDETFPESSNKQLLVKSKQKPAYIYYGWQPFNKENLVNGEQLPASTFKLKIE